MGWAHLGFWGSLIAFAIFVWLSFQRAMWYIRRSRLDDESRLKYLRDQHKSKEDMAEDEKGMKVMAFCFCAACLFGHLAESPVSDTWNAYVEWVRPSGAE